MMITESLSSLVDQMPDPDDRGMYTQNIDKDRIEKAVEAIFRGGRENVQGLIDMLGQPGSEQDVKPHYALHCVLNYALIAGDDTARREFAVTLAQNLSRDLSNYHKAFLCQELQWMGREEAAEALGQLLLDDELVEPAAMALVAIKSGAVTVLRTALPQATGKCRLNIIDALAALEDADCLDELQAALQDEDQEVRIAARAGLARLAEPAAARAVLKSSESAEGWERIQAASCCLAAAESLVAAGQPAAAKKIYSAVESLFVAENESHIRAAAQAGRTALSP